MATSTQLNQIYLAYFGRPADADGLAYYANVPMGDVIAGFSASPESVSMYGATFGVAQVSAIYTNLFNRPATTGEALYWIDAITRPGGPGPAAAALSIMAGAQNDDLAAVTNKLAVSAAFSAAVDTPAEMAGYSGAAAAAAARAFLKTVDSTPASVVIAQAAVPAQVAATVPPPPPGSSPLIKLIYGGDTLMGTAADDQFAADLVTVNGNLEETLQTGDVVDGAGGNDTLSITLKDGAAVYPTLSRVENVALRSTAAGGTLVLAFATGVQRATIADSTAAGIILGLDAIATIEVRGQSAAASFGQITAPVLAVELTNVGTALALTDVSIGEGGPATSDTLNIQATNAHVQLLDGGTNVTTINVAAMGVNRLQFTDESATVTSLAVTGTGSVDFTGAQFNALNTLTVGQSNSGIKIDLTRQVTSLTTSYGDDRITFVDGVDASAVVSLGDGNDKLVLGAAPDAGATLSGGNGNDTLAMSAAIWDMLTGWSAPDLAKITGFETLEITDVMATRTIDMSKLAGVTAFASSGGIAQLEAVTLDNMPNGGTLAMTGTPLAFSNGSFVVNVVNAAAGTADALTLKLATDSDTATVFLTAQNVEAVTVNVVKSSIFSFNNSVTLMDAALQSLTLTGNNMVNVMAFAGLPFTSLTRIDASGSIAGVTLALESGVATTTITGSAYADTFFIGSNDTVTGNGGIDGSQVFRAGDVFNILTTAAGQALPVITDIHRGDRLIFKTQGTASFDTHMLAPPVNTTLANYLDAAAAGNPGANSTLKYFQFSGDTYVVEDRSASGSFVYGTDVAVKLVGLQDLSTSTLPSTAEPRIIF